MDGADGASDFRCERGTGARSGEHFGVPFMETFSGDGYGCRVGSLDVPHDYP